MKTKELKITPPEGYEIDKENSTFECIKFKKKKSVLYYEEIVCHLFEKNEYYFTDSFGRIDHSSERCGWFDPNSATSKKQLEKLLAINKLMNVAKYLNGDWKPNWGDRSEFKYYIYSDVVFYSGNTSATFIKIDFTVSKNSSLVYFKTEEFAKKAVEILDEDNIRLVLSTDW